MVVWECVIQDKQKLEKEVLVSLVENWLLVRNEFIEIRGDAAP